MTSFHFFHLDVSYGKTLLCFMTETGAITSITENKPDKYIVCIVKK